MEEKELYNTARSKREKANQAEQVAQNRLWGSDLTATAFIHSALPDLPQTEIKGCGRSFTLYPDSKDEQRSPHCLPQVSPSLGGPSQALGILCNPKPALTILCCCTLDRAHRSLHSTTGPQGSSGKASSSSLPQIITESNKYYLVSWKTLY